MKKQITTAALLITTAMFFASCESKTSESNTEKMEQTANAMYQCP
jgi:PBP1b-binding outer membrane lipoprotein LpoB